MAMITTHGSLAALALAAVSLGLPVAAQARGIVITFDDPEVVDGSPVYLWDLAKDGTTDIQFVSLDGAFSTMGPGGVYKYVSTPGLEGGLIDGPEIQVNFIANYGFIEPGRGITGPFSFGFALNTFDFIPLAVTFSIYGEDGALLGAISASAASGGVGDYSEGRVILPNPPVKAVYGLIDFNSNVDGTRYILDNFGYVPETSTWLMLIAGFGLVGSAARRRRAVSSA